MKPKHIVFIMDSNGFPNGMASTQRVKLLSKGLLKTGYDVTILCIRALERQPIENIDVKGCYQGVQFEYTSGTTIRADNFIKRRWLEIRGLLVSFFRILHLKASGAIDCIYLFDATGKLTFLGSIYKIFAVILKIPLIIELNERPWSLKENPAYLEKRISPLIGATGVIVISSFLNQWVESEVKRTSKNVAILYIPILIDSQESIDVDSQFPHENPVLMFAGAPQYDETIRFLFETMREVIKINPLCRLIISGIKETDPAGAWLLSEKTSEEIQNNISLIGYVSRSELLELYRRSTALLIPLFDDVRSKARFPTKLGEYLMSGRPVITNNVGELTKYLVNGRDAFFCEPGDPTAYAKLILQVLDDPIRTNAIGQKGKETACQHFDYSLWGHQLAVFIKGICKDPI
jgi:glycosyltransferase involved in cell wall biosynthesis